MPGLGMLGERDRLLAPSERRNPIVEQRIDRDGQGDAHAMAGFGARASRWSLRREERSLHGPIVFVVRRYGRGDHALHVFGYALGRAVAGRPALSAPRVRVVHGKRGRELIVDGTFASFYRPGSPVTGSVWDAIVAPLLSLPERHRRDVLILGLGGGSAARIVRAIAPQARIVGVEFDAAVVRAAREHFDLDDLDVEVVEADALAFLREDAAHYDAIFEDVFVGQGDDVHKPGWLPDPGLSLAAERLVPGGVLTSNALDEAPAVSAAFRELFPRTVRIDVEDYDNRVFAGGAELPTAGDLRKAVEANPVLASSLRRLTFRTLG
jgi:SAM-dependent methyltransferase